MPIFEFRCQKCGNEFEKIVFNQNSKIQCPGCSSSKVEKKVSAFSFKSGSKFVAASSKAGGCSSCASHHCSTCH